jgi:hypothetical protein
VLDHGEYAPSDFAAVCLSKDGGPGGWRPTRHNGDALWHEIPYGDTCVPGSLPPPRTHAASGTACEGDAGSLLPRSHVHGPAQPAVPVAMATYEDPFIDAVRNLGRVPAILDVEALYYQRLAEALAGTGSRSARRHPALLAALPVRPTDASLSSNAQLRRAPQTARAGAMTATTLGADVQHWKPLVARPTTTSAAASGPAPTLPQQCSLSVPQTSQAHAHPEVRRARGSDGTAAQFDGHRPETSLPRVGAPSPARAARARRQRSVSSEEAGASRAPNAAVAEQRGRRHSHEPGATRPGFA